MMTIRSTILLLTSMMTTTTTMTTIIMIITMTTKTKTIIKNHSTNIKSHNHQAEILKTNIKDKSSDYQMRIFIIGEIYSTESSYLKHLKTLRKVGFQINKKLFLFIYVYIYINYHNNFFFR